MPEDRLKELGLTLPSPPKPAGSYVPCVKAGGLLFVSGQLPFKQGKILRQGQVDTEVSLAEAKEAAKTCVLNGLAAVKAELGDLKRIKRVVRLTGYVASSRGFSRQPEVLNSASDLLFSILGEAGLHTRVAVGVSHLPLMAPVEIALILSVEE